MAVTATVTKASVSERMPKLWSVSLTLTLKEASVTVLERTFSEDYKLGQALAPLGARFIEQMQKVIDAYKGEQTVLNHEDLDAVVVGVQAGLEVS